MMQNIRRMIPGFPGYSATRDGRIWSHRSKRWLAQFRADAHGHVGIGPVGARSTLYVHRAVALAWIPNPDNLPCVLHGDDDPTNNHVTNLRWGTQADNVRDMISAGRQCAPPHPTGSAHPSAKLAEADVLVIRKLLAEGVSQRVLARRFGVSQPVINRIGTRRIWRSI